MIYFFSGFGLSLETILKGRHVLFLWGPLENLFRRGRVSLSFLKIIVLGIGMILGLMPFTARGAELPWVTLQLLDKVTSKTQSLEIRDNDIKEFGTLRFRVYRCHKSPPEENPESTAFLEVWDQKTTEAPVPVFKGWLFSSTPSTLEHPVYDIRLLECHACTTCCKKNSFVAGKVEEVVVPPSSPPSLNPPQTFAETDEVLED